MAQISQADPCKADRNFYKIHAMIDKLEKNDKYTLAKIKYKVHFNLYLKYSRRHREEGDWCFICNKDVLNGHCECNLEKCNNFDDFYNPPISPIIRYKICETCFKTKCEHIDSIVL